MKVDIKRKIILTADDYCASKLIDEGILTAVKYGTINTVSALVNMKWSAERIEELKNTAPGTGIGVHVSLTSGEPVSPVEEVPSLVDRNGQFYNLEEILERIQNINLREVIKETENQIKKLESMGIKPDHLSSHHNIMQVYTPFFRILVKLAKKRNIPMRSTRPLSRIHPDFSYSQTKKKSAKAVLYMVSQNPITIMKIAKYGTNAEMEKNQRKMKHNRIPHPDYLADSFWGEPTPHNLRYILKHMPEGTSELVFHLGSHDGEYKAPKGVDEKYYSYRELELFCVTSPEFMKWIEREHIEIVKFSDL